MDRHFKISFSGILCWLLWICLFCDIAMADEAVKPQSPIIEAVNEEPEDNNKAVVNDQDKSHLNTNADTPATNSFTSQFPHLQRALIIAIIINVVIIIFSLMMYLVKRKMQRITPLSMVRSNQDG